MRACVLLIYLMLAMASTAAAQDIFILPETFATPRREEVTVAVSVSPNFPGLGAPPERAGYSTPWRANVFNHFPRGEGWYSMTPLGSDETASRYSFEHDRRGWVRVNASTQLGERTLSAAEREALLGAVTLTAAERASFQPPSGPIRVNSYVVLSSFVCIARCDAPEVTMDDSNVQAIRQRDRAPSLCTWSLVVPRPDCR